MLKKSTQPTLKVKINTVLVNLQLLRPMLKSRMTIRTRFNYKMQMTSSSNKMKLNDRVNRLKAKSCSFVPVLMIWMFQWSTNFCS